MRIERILNNPEEIADETVIDLALLQPIVNKYNGKRGGLIPVLQGAQNIYGFLPKQVILKLASDLGYKLSDMYGVATFYSQFRLKPVGKHIIKMCHGTACHVQNVSAVTTALKETLKVEDGETTKDGLFTLETVACLGCCSLAPVMMIGDDTYGNLDSTMAVRTIKKIRISENN